MRRSPGSARWVDREAVRFEQAWKGVARPRIEDYLAGVAEPRRGLLRGSWCGSSTSYVSEWARSRVRPGIPRRIPGRRCGDWCRLQAAADYSSSTAAATEDAPRPNAEGPGDRIGPYKLIEEIGEGGMGSVFMAQQTEPVKRAVAVKVIKAGMDSKAVLARFEAERQALAMMDHPNIARVLDAGTTDGGRPFFVMELVKGTPITAFCDERKLHAAAAAGAVRAGLPGDPARPPEGHHPPRHQAVATCWWPCTTTARCPRSSTSAWPRPPGRR